MARTLVVGEALVDVVDEPGRSREHVGGSPTNVALGLARLGHPTALATSIGEDERGRRIAETVAAGGVELTDESVHSGATTTALARIDPTGAADYTFDWMWDSPLPRGPVDGHTHTGSLAALWPPAGGEISALIGAARQTGTTSYDPNLRPGALPEQVDVAAGVEALVAASDLVKCSEDDLAWLYPGEALDAILGRWVAAGASLVVVTLGADGVRWHHGSGATGNAPTRATRVVDTVGAGDSFMAGLLSALLDAGLLGDRAAGERLRGAAPEEVTAAVERGLACAALTVGHAGAHAPTRADLGLPPA